MKFFIPSKQSVGVYESGSLKYQLAGFGVVENGLPAPVISIPGMASVNDTVGTPTMYTDTGSGTGYYVVALATATAPTGTQIVAGTDGDDVAGVDADSKVVTGVGVVTFPQATGMTASTNYTVYMVHVDGGTSNVIDWDFTTDAAPAGGSGSRTTIGILIAI